MVQKQHCLAMSCDVLLSVYGTTEYLKPFLASLATQRGVVFRLLYRFDGEPSADVVRLLTAFPGSREVSGRAHLGVVGSYRTLLQASEADCFCFADQDDVWQVDKLVVLKEALLRAEGRFGPEIPLLVHSDLRVVDRESREIAPSFVRYQSLNPSLRSLRHLLVQNNVTGCALMGNRALREVTGAIPDAAICHDWYLALVAAAFGRIAFVDHPLVDYRQHGANVYGAVRRRKSVVGGLRRAELHAHIAASQRQASAFLSQFSDRLPLELRKVVSAWAGMTEVPRYLRRLRIAFECGFRKNDWLRTIGMVVAL